MLGDGTVAGTGENGRIRPDDLYALCLDAKYMGARKPGNACMAYITHLTGLRALDIHETNITGAGLKSIAVLTDLLHFTGPARMDDTGCAFGALSSLTRFGYCWCPHDQQRGVSLE